MLRDLTELILLRKERESRYRLEELVGKSKAMQDIWQKAGLPMESPSADFASPSLRRSGWLRVAGTLAVLIMLRLGLAVSPVYALVRGGLLMIMAVTGNGTCCSSGGCSPRRQA